MNPVSIRLLNQHLYAPQFSKPEEVVAHFGAMQAQEYRMMRWAVAMRTRKPSFAAFSKAFNSGKIIRMHLLRGTWQLVAAEDYAWMLSLCAPKAKQIINGWMSSNKIIIPEREVFAIREILADTAELLGSATKDDFELALAQKGISMDNHRLSYHIRYAELDGVLCSGDLLPMKASYALAESKVHGGVNEEPAVPSYSLAESKVHGDVNEEPAVPSYSLAESKVMGGGVIDRDEALMRLAKKYFQSHQPATLEDFAWWSGLGLNDCRRALDILGNSIHEFSNKGRQFYLLDNCRTRGFHKDDFLLIAPYDEYLIGYKSRDLVLDPTFRHYAHNNSGIFQPVVAYDGHICGNWSPFKETPSFNFFSAPLAGMPNTSKLTKAWNSYANTRK